MDNSDPGDLADRDMDTNLHLSDPKKNINSKIPTHLRILFHRGWNFTSQTREKRSRYFICWLKNFQVISLNDLLVPKNWQPNFSTDNFSRLKGNGDVYRFIFQCFTPLDL